MLIKTGGGGTIRPGIAVIGEQQAALSLVEAVRKHDPQAGEVATLTIEGAAKDLAKVHAARIVFVVDDAREIQDLIGFLQSIRNRGSVVMVVGAVDGRRRYQIVDAQLGCGVAESVDETAKHMSEMLRYLTRFLTRWSYECLV
jgi:hypothetical protein